MNVVLGIGLLAGIVFAISWAIEPLWSRSSQDQKSKRTAPVDALGGAPPQVELLERDLLEGVISPDDFSVLAGHIRVESTPLAAQYTNVRNLDTLSAGSMAEHGGFTDVNIPANDDRGEASDLANKPRARIWVVGSATTLVIFAVLVIVIRKYPNIDMVPLQLYAGITAMIIGYIIAGKINKALQRRLDLETEGLL